MSTQNPTHHHRDDATVEEKAGEVITTTVDKIDRNKNVILYVLLGILVIVAAVLAYINLYHIPHQKAGDEALYKAESYFAKDSFRIALEGNGADVMGFRQVIDKYGNTKAGNLAHYYAGVSLFHLGKYDEAISELKKYKGDDLMVAPAAKGLIGDALVELGKTEDAIGYFEDSAKKADNEVLSPVYLRKAALAYKALGKNDKALELFRTIKTKYAASPVAADVDKYITELSL